MRYSHTKIVGPVGKYGPRYGSTLRKRTKSVLVKRYSAHQCPFCGSVGTVKRVSIGIWTCKKCKNIWAGGAYEPKSSISTYLPKFYKT